MQGFIRYSKKTNVERMASGEEITRRWNGYPLTGTSFVFEKRKEKRIVSGNPTNLTPGSFAFAQDKLLSKCQVRI
jgi:hypothetical protein